MHAYTHVYTHVCTHGQVVKETGLAADADEMPNGFDTKVRHM